MTQIAVTKKIERSIDDVWPVLADFAGTATYNPEVLASRSMNGLATGLGARRHCQLDQGGQKWTEEEIIEFEADRHRYVLRIVEGPGKPPIDDVRVEMSAHADRP